MPPDLRREVVGDEQVAHVVAEPATGRARLGRPGRVSPASGVEQVVTAQPPAAHTAWPRTSGSAVASAPDGARPATVRIVGAADVAQHDQRVAAQVARLAARDVPAAEPVEQRVVVGGEQLEHVDPVRRAHPTRGDAPIAVPRSVDGRFGRAHLLAVVAAVEPVAERDPVLDREDALGLHQPGQAAAGVDHARARRWLRSGSRRGSGGTTPQPSATGSAAVGASGASVSTEPSTNQLPSPGTSRLAFLPYQPRPARCAAARSTSALSSSTTRAVPAVGPEALGDGVEPVRGAPRSGRSAA